jgi:ABC-2 type transport system permease protein
LRLYLSVARRAFNRYSTYRIASFAGVFTQSVFGFIMTYTYIALWENRPNLGGYDVTDAITYVWIGQALLAPLALFGGGFQHEFAERIRKGDIAIDLYRPIDLQLWWLASDFGRAAFQLIVRGGGPMLFGTLAFQLRYPSDLLTWLAFGCALVIALTVSFAIRYLVCLTAFWLLDSRGVEQVAGFCGMFFSGMVLPLNIFPGALGELSRALPWAATLQVPADVFLGKHHGTDLVQTLGMSAMWALVLLLAGQLLTAFATKKVVVQGG